MRCVHFGGSTVLLRHSLPQSHGRCFSRLRDDRPACVVVRARWWCYPLLPRCRSSECVCARACSYGVSFFLLRTPVSSFSRAPSHISDAPACVFGTHRRRALLSRLLFGVSRLFFMAKPSTHSYKKSGARYPRSRANGNVSRGPLTLSFLRLR